MRDFEEGASPATSGSGSATDISEDSVEVRVVPVRRPSGNAVTAMTSSSSTSSPANLSVRRHKRKSAEPRKLKDTTNTTATTTAPPTAPKRCKWDQAEEEAQSSSRTMQDPTALCLSSSIVAPVPTSSSTTFFDVTEEEEEDDDDDEGFEELASVIASSDPRCRMPFYDALNWTRAQRGRTSCSNVAMVPLRTSSAASTSRTDSEEVASTSAEVDVDADADVDEDGDDLFQKPKSYKNMTRERRMEANARERTRVHTISAAFESLRRAVPSYSCHQKLSKLAILRIACSYILALASLNDMDYSQEQDNPSFGECVDLCTRTIQAEGRTRKRKE